MAVQGKKINELTAIGTVSNETVLPAVYVSGTTVNSTANKISIEQISAKVQDDMSTTLAGKQDTLVSGTNIKTINNESLLGNGNLEVDALPSQTGQSGKFLTTDGTNASWADVSANVYTKDNLLAGQAVSLSNSGLYDTKATGSSGSYITTNKIYDLGSAGSWEIRTKYKMLAKGTSGTSSIISYSGQPDAKFPSLFINHSNSGNDLYFLLSSNGSYWNLAEGSVGAPSLVDGETYYIRYGFSGTEYYCYVGTNGFDTATKYTLLTSSTKVYAGRTMMLLNVGGQTGTFYNIGTLDMGATQIIMDNDIVFNGQDIDTWTNSGCVLQQTEIAATKKINFDPTVITGYNASQKQRLVNDNGTLKWEAVS